MSSPSSNRRVRFKSVLDSPSDERPKRIGVVYPKVAQSKGLLSSDRLSSTDLRWAWSALSSALAEEQCQPPRSKSLPEIYSSESIDVSSGGEDIGVSEQAHLKLEVEPLRSVPRLIIPIAPYSPIPLYDLQIVLPDLSSSSSFSSTSSSRPSNGTVTPNN